VAWSAESDAIYYLAGTGNASNQGIYRAGIDPGTGQPDGSDIMVFDGALPRQFDIAPDGSALALVGGNAWYNVFTGTADGANPVRMERVTTGTAWTASPGYSADGRTLTFSRFAGLPPQGSLHLRASRRTVTVRPTTSSGEVGRRLSWWWICGAKNRGGWERAPGGCRSNGRRTGASW
jgi:Tol biopolymer transport system component